MPRLLTLERTAEQMSCTTRHVQNLIRKGKLHAVDIGLGGKRKTLRVSEEEIQNFEERANRPKLKRRRWQYRGKQYV